jgi:hypothetical protein
MPTPSVATPLEFSVPVVVYVATFTGLTADGTTQNACVIGGLPVGFTPNGALTFAMADSGSGTARAVYASYDRETLAIDGSDPTLCNIDIYTKDASGSGATVTTVLIW